MCVAAHAVPTSKESALAGAQRGNNGRNRAPCRQAPDWCRGAGREHTAGGQHFVSCELHTDCSTGFRLAATPQSCKTGQSCQRSQAQVRHQNPHRRRATTRTREHMWPRLTWPPIRSNPILMSVPPTTQLPKSTEGQQSPMGLFPGLVPRVLSHAIPILQPPCSFNAYLYILLRAVYMPA